MQKRAIMEIDLWRAIARHELKPKVQYRPCIPAEKNGLSHIPEPFAGKLLQKASSCGLNTHDGSLLFEGQGQLKYQANLLKINVTSIHVKKTFSLQAINLQGRQEAMLLASCKIY